jgi:hypothetical protein
MDDQNQGSSKEFTHITPEEWLDMRRSWSENRDDFLASSVSRMNSTNPYIYITANDGHYHPCDAPDLEPREFFLAIMRDSTIPFDCRVFAIKVLSDNFEEYNLRHVLTEEDGAMLGRMHALLTRKGLTVQ